MGKFITKYFCIAFAAITATVFTVPKVSADDYVAQPGLKSIQLLHGWRTKEGSHMAAIHIQLENGWKTYWRKPGSNGIPPQFTWKGKNKISSVRYHWPSPKVFIDRGVQTIGYKNQLLLPVEIFPSAKSDDIEIKASVDFGVCKDICIPISATIKGRLLAADGGAKREIQKALSNKPISQQTTGISASCNVNPTKDGLEVTANVNAGAHAAKVRHAVIEFLQPDIWTTHPTVRKQGGHLYATAQMKSFSSAPFILDRGKILITLITNNRAFEIRGCPSA